MTRYTYIITPPYFNLDRGCICPRSKTFLQKYLTPMHNVIILVLTIIIQNRRPIEFKGSNFISLLETKPALTCSPF